MPELPEVEHGRRQWTAWGVGRRVAVVDVVDATAFVGDLSERVHKGKSTAAKARKVRGQRLVEARRRGKRLGLLFEDHGWLVHFGMTGYFERGTEAPAHARWGVSFEGAAPVWFVDPRRFGCVLPLPAADLETALADGLGPDMLLDAPTGPDLAARSQGRRAIKVALMDQAVVAGIGNMHAAEALWRAHISPRRPASGLRPSEWEALAIALRDQVSEAVPDDLEPMTYVSAGGPNPFSVYDRDGEPCPRCGTLLVGIRLGGRSTVYCPHCQRDGDVGDG